MLFTCFSTARSVTTSASAIARVRAALGHQAEHLALARGQVVERVAAPGAGEELRDDLRVDHGAAGGDAVDGVEEVADVGDAVLEQVADAARVAATSSSAA